MHHFTAFYSEVMTEHFDIMETMWQHEMPRIAFSSQYVMHGLLGFSALHLATIQPERAHLLRASATNHLDQALGFYRQDTGPNGREFRCAIYLHVAGGAVRIRDPFFGPTH